MFTLHSQFWRSRVVVGGLEQGSEKIPEVISQEMAGQRENEHAYAYGGPDIERGVVYDSGDSSPRGWRVFDVKEDHQEDGDSDCDGALDRKGQRCECKYGAGSQAN